MWQATRRQLTPTYAISLGIMTACMSLLLPVPSAYTQQLIGTISQGAIGTGTQKKDTQTTLTNKPHRLIRKPQNAPIASVAPSPSGTSPVSSVPTSQASLQTDNTTSQSTEPSALNKTVGTTVPLATMSVAPSSATTSGTIAVGITSTGTIPLAAASTGNSSTSGSGSAGGRSMSTLAAEMPGLAQLITPPSAPSAPSAPIVPVNPAIGASPTSLSFTAQQGSSDPNPQTVTISNTGGGTLNWNASDNATWLTVSPASGTGNGAVTLTATTGTLTAGSYPAVVTMSATGATTVTVPVTFTVTAAPVPPAIGASPTSFSFTATQGGSNPAAQTLNISNTGGGTLSWTASDNATWLTLSPGTGTGNGTVTLSAVTGTLTPATYTGTVTLSGGTGVTSVTIPVSFTVAAAPAISISPSSLSYTATQGAANPASQSLAVSSNQTWTASDNASWLTVTPTSGSNNGTITVSVNTATAVLGANTATITATGGGITKTVTVTLTLNTPSTSSATLTWTPNTETDLASYRIYRSTTQGVYGAAVATVPAGTATYTSTGLPVGSTYFFTITAVDSANNESLQSNEVNKVIP